MDKFQKAFLDAITTDKGLSSNFLAQIKPVGSLTSEDVITVYRNDYEARLEEALGKNFEATWLLLGDDDFHELSQLFIKLHPSHLKNLTSYGYEFPEFLKSESQESYVIEMANFEKHFWQIFHQAPRTLKPLDQEGLTSREFNLQSGIYLSHSSLKLHDLWLLREGSDQELSLDDFESEEYLAVYRSEGRVEVQKLTAGQFQILGLIRECKNLEKTFQQLEDLKVATVQEDWPVVFQILSYF